MLVGGILVFENLKLKDMIGYLEKIDTGDLVLLKRIFLQMEDLEATAYYQTIKNRLEVINAFEKIVDDNTKEKIIQEYLFEHLWVLDPSWERVSGTAHMEKSMERAFEAAAKDLSDEQRAGRIDLKYRTTSGKHVIIELKRPSITTTTSDLQAQISKYRAAAVRVLKSKNKGSDPVEIVCVLGRPPQDWDDPDGEKLSRESLESYGARVVMYDELIENAQKAYKEYTEKGKNVTRIFNLIQSITNSNEEA